MLREVARCADQFTRQLQRQGKTRIAGVEIEFACLIVAHAFERPSPHEPRERPGHVLGQTQRLADLAHRAAGAIARYHRRQSGAGAAIGLIDPLDDLLPPLMFEIDVDVGRFLALARHEPFEKQFMLDGIDRGDAQHEADAAVRRRSPPLAENAPPSRFSDDAVHGQKIGGIAQLFDQPELMGKLIGIGFGHAIGKHAGRCRPRQPLQQLLRRFARTCFLRILIAKLIEVEGAGMRDVGRCCQRIGIGGKAPGHFRAGLELPIGIALALEPQRIDGAMVTDRGHNILQQLAIIAVIEDVTQHHRSHMMRSRLRIETMNPDRIVRPSAQRQPKIGAIAKCKV